MNLFTRLLSYRSPARSSRRPARPLGQPIEVLESRDVPSTLLASGLEGAQGSTVGPGRDLYVTEGLAGRISRVNSRTGKITTFATGLPVGPYGGASDVAFIGGTAYVLVTLVGPDVGGNDVVGIYRVNGPHSFTVIADIGTWSTENPPETEFELPTGVQYAMEPYRGGFLVTDGHHNRVLRVGLDGEISEQIAFDNIVPTGLAVSGNKIYVAEAGPVPHLPQDGKIVAFRPRSTTASEVAAGAPLLVDVEFGCGQRLYALSQGDWNGQFPGDPADPDTGALVRVTSSGNFNVVESGLDRPSSLEFIGNDAYVVTLTGEIWKIKGVAGVGHGRSAVARSPHWSSADALVAVPTSSPSDGSGSRVGSGIGRDVVSASRYEPGAAKGKPFAHGPWLAVPATGLGNDLPNSAASNLEMGGLPSFVLGEVLNGNDAVFGMPIVL